MNGKYLIIPRAIKQVQESYTRTHFDMQSYTYVHFGSNLLCWLLWYLKCFIAVCLCITHSLKTAIKKNETKQFAISSLRFRSVCVVAKIHWFLSLHLVKGVRNVYKFDLRFQVKETKLQIPMVTFKFTPLDESSHFCSGTKSKPKTEPTVKTKKLKQIKGKKTGKSVVFKWKTTHTQKYF